MNHHVIYQAYGNTAILHELLYSVYSLLRLYPNRPPFGIVIYTDNQPFLADKLPDWIEYRSFQPGEVATWSGPDKFVHRVKIRTLLDFVGTHTGKLLYVDTDTVFTQPIDPLFEMIADKRYVMHIQESRLDSPKHLLFRKITAFLKQNPQMTVPADTMVCNAGVLGLRCDDEPVLTQVLQLTDKLYSAYPKHVMEQLAFSVVLTHHNSIAEAEPFVYHYWNFKEFRSVLGEFFAFNAGQPYPSVINKIDQIDPRKLIEPKMAYEKLSFWPKAVRKLKRERWTLPTFTLS